MFPIKTNQGYRVGSVTRDITEHKQAEEAVSRSQRTFSELVERAPFGIYVVDSQFRIAHMNVGSQAGAFRNVRPVIGRDFAEAMRILWPEPVAAEQYSGRLQLRIPSGLHYRAAERARAEGISLNRLLSDAVSTYIGIARGRKAKRDE